MLMRRLRLGCFDGLSPFRCRHSIALPPIHRYLSPTATIHRRELSDLPPAAATTAKDPTWVMLHCIFGNRMDDSIAVDADTVADSRTSTGRRLRVSFRRAAPPVSSSVYYDWPDSAPGDEDNNDGINVIAAHGDSALLEMRDMRSPYAYKNNYFVYRVGGGAARPPSLTQLPPRDFLMEEGSTGLLRRGEDELLVVRHKLKHDRLQGRFMAEFCVHRLGTSNWELDHTVPILDDDASDDRPCYEMKGWATVGPIPVGDRFLCWVQSDSHFLLSDMADVASPKVRYAPLPPDLSRCSDDDDEEEDYNPTRKPFYSKGMGAAGDSQVKFVRVEKCRCCGGPGKISTCARSRFAFTVSTWTMKLSMDEPLTWVKDGVLDCEEVWALPGYEGLPRAYLECPIVSLENPDIVCFSVTNFELARCREYTVWLVKLNMRNKTLLSVVRYTTDPWRAYYHLPAKLHC